MRTSGQHRRYRFRQHRARHRRSCARSCWRSAARPRGRRARDTAGWLRASGNHFVCARRAASARHRRPLSRDPPACNRASGHRRDDPLGQGPARTHYRRPRHRQDRNRRGYDHQPAIEQRYLRLCGNRAESIVGRTGDRGRAPLRCAGTLPFRDRRSQRRAGPAMAHALCGLYNGGIFYGAGARRLLGHR